MLPLLILFGGFVAIKAIHDYSKKTVPTATPATHVGGNLPARSALRNLAVVLRQGYEPEEWEIEEAIEEAYDKRDWRTVAKLHRYFYEDVASDGSDTSDESDGPDDETENQEQNESPDVETIVGSLNVSPLEGVPRDSWDTFVSRLETQSPDYQGPKHVGRFHHSKERLAQLQIADVSTPEKQYDALVADMVDARDKAADLIREFECKPIALGDGEKVATLSGILAVVKSAGLERSRSWFTHPEDRSKFPKTTEMFQKTNGVF